MELFMPTEIGPVPGPLFDPNAYVPVTSSDLNLTQDTIQKTAPKFSTGINLDPSNPNLSIFGFAHLVSTSRLVFKQTTDAFDASEAGMYKDFHRNSVITIQGVLQQIKDLRNFRDDYNNFIDTLNNFADPLFNRVDNLQSSFKDIQNGEDFYGTWGKVADAAYFLNQPTTTQEETDKRLEDYYLWASHYNARASTMDGILPSETKTIIGINSYISTNTATLQPTVDSLNQTYALLGLSSPTVSPLPNLTDIATYATYPLIPISPPPPYPPNLYFSSPVPRGGNLPYPPVPGPYTLADPNFDVPNKINHDVFQAQFLQPLFDLIDELKNAQKRVQNAIDFQQVFRPDFGQVAISAPYFTPHSSPVSGGASHLLSGIAANQGHNLRFDEQFGQAQLQLLYARFNIPEGSPLRDNVGGYTENLFQSLLNAAVPAATDLSQTARVGTSAGNSPSVQASLALGTLQNVLGLVSADSVYNTILQHLIDQAKTDPANNNKSEATLRAELEPLARGIAAAINLQLIKTAVLQVEQAIGVSGLLPQILANLGSVSTDSILQLVNGTINYRNLFDSPRDLQLVAFNMRDVYEESLGLDRQQAERAVSRALERASHLGPFSTSDAAREALRSSLDPRIADQVFTRLDNPSTSQQALLDGLQTNALATNVENELSRHHLDADELNRINTKIDTARDHAHNATELRTAIEGILQQEGIEGAPELLASAFAAATSSLHNPYLNQIASRDTVSSDFTLAVQNVFSSQGVPPDTATQQATHYSDLIFNNPSSVSNLIALNLRDYAHAVGQTQSEAADGTFRDTMRPQLSTAAFLQRLADPALEIVFRSNPIFYGSHGQPRTGPGPGVYVSETMV